MAPVSSLLQILDPSGDTSGSDARVGLLEEWAFDQVDYARRFQINSGGVEVLL